MRCHEITKTDFLEEVPLLLSSDFSFFGWALKGTFSHRSSFYSVVLGFRVRVRVRMTDIRPKYSSPGAVGWPKLSGETMGSCVGTILNQKYYFPKFSGFPFQPKTSDITFFLRGVVGLVAPIWVRLVSDDVRRQRANSRHRRTALRSPPSGPHVFARAVSFFPHRNRLFFLFTCGTSMIFCSHLGNGMVPRNRLSVGFSGDVKTIIVFTTGKAVSVINLWYCRATVRSRGTRQRRPSSGWPNGTTRSRPLDGPLQ